MNNISMKVKGDEWIEIPRKDNPGSAKSYSFKKGKISFTFDGSGRYSIPQYAERMRFIYYSHRGGHINYGEPIFE